MGTCKVPIFFTPTKQTMKSYTRIFSLSILLLLLILISPHKLLLAKPYSPTSPIVIKTQILEGLIDARKRPVTMTYTATCETGPTMRPTLAWHLGPDSSGEVLARITIDAERLHIQKKNSPRGESINGVIYLADGYPVPIDILPVNQEAAVQKYNMEQQGGNRVFLTPYTVSITPISVAAAVEKGWVNAQDFQAVEVSFHLVSAKKASGKIAARQLWPEDGEWWVYEETPFRRSWRLFANP